MKPTTTVFLTGGFLAALLFAPLASAQSGSTTPSATGTASLQAPRMHAEGRSRHDHRRHRNLERFDRDLDGRISRAEFDAGMAGRESRHRGSSASERQPPDFAAIDRNHDGYVVASEVRAFHERMRPLRQAERQKRFDERFARSDLNHDGRLGRVEVGETMPRLATHFAWLDENRDGFLSRVELQAARHDRR